MRRGELRELPGLSVETRENFSSPELDKKGTIMIVSCPNPQCHTKLKIDDSLAGRQGRCPHCNTPFMIPTLDEVSQAAHHPHRHHEEPAPGAGQAPAARKAAPPPAAVHSPPPAQTPPASAQAYAAPAGPDAFAPTPQPHPFAASAPAQPPVPTLPSKALLDRLKEGIAGALRAAMPPAKPRIPHVRRNTLEPPSLAESVTFGIGVIVLVCGAVVGVISMMEGSHLGAFGGLIGVISGLVGSAIPFGISSALGYLRRIACAAECSAPTRADEGANSPP